MKTCKRNIALFLSCCTFVLVADSSLAAGQWKPLCIEGGICTTPLGNSHRHQDRHAIAPLVVGDQLWLNYRSVDVLAAQATDDYSFPWQIFSVSAQQPFVSLPAGTQRTVSDVYSVALDNDTVMSSTLYSATVYDASLESPEQLFSVYWNGTDPNLNPAALNNQVVIGPPVQLDGTIYLGATGTGLYKSDNAGLNWERISSTWEYIPVTWDYDPDFYSPLPSGGDRFHLGVNSDKSALWYLGQTWRDPEATLLQSIDQGESWTRVDDGSFPQDAMKIVHDPSHAGSSYAVTLNGLYVSGDSGVSWQITGLLEAVHGVVFVERAAPLGRVLVAGTDTGVKVSVDEGSTWKDMSAGLLSIPHTVSHVDGILLATSDAGYFSCNAVDCAGDGQGVGHEEELGQVTVVEFFNTDLKHYFLTASMAETQAIENGAAGPGWLRTGETFQAWSVLPAKTDQGWNILPYYGTNAMIVCRFYGSTNPGPNSHFYTVNTDECGTLIDLQQQTPENKPRWNLESYAFAVIPKQTDANQPCLDDMVPVYRFYNDAFKRGEDSNHRYVTDPALLEPMLLEGWIDEGVVFCAAPPQI